MRVLSIFTVVVLLQLTEATNINQTEVCSFRKGLEEINLAPLSSLHVFTEFIQTENTHGLKEVYWNPCSPVSRGVCSVALCARFTKRLNKRLLGLATQSSARLVVERDDVFLQYSTVFGGKVSILLVCSDRERLVYIDKNLQRHMDTYLMTLSSRHACWREFAPVTTASPPNTTSNVTVPTPPAVITVTSAPSDGKAVAFLLLIEVLATILILLVLLSGTFVYLNHKLKQRREAATPPAYEHLYLDEEHSPDHTHILLMKDLIKE